MTVPVELFVWMLGGLGAFLSIVIHLLIKMNGSINEVKTSQAVFQAKAEARLRTLYSRHVPTEDKSEHSF